MRLEIAERLRCPRAHAPTPLVLVAERVVDRELIDGIAGCPVCLNEARIQNGDVSFAGLAAPPASVPHRAVGDPPAAQPDRAALDRLRALLQLGEPGGAVLLTGRYARFAARLAEDLDVAVIVMAATSVPGRGVSCVRAAERAVPFSDHTFRAAALDAALEASAPASLESSFASAFLADAVRCVEIGGRVIGGADLTLPPLLRDLARDQTEWVGEREAGPPRFERLRLARVK